MFFQKIFLLGSKGWLIGTLIGSNRSDEKNENLQVTDIFFLQSPATEIISRAERTEVHVYEDQV